MSIRYRILLVILMLHFSLIQVMFLAQADIKPVTKPIISFCVGSFHACAVFSNNRMKCWGSGRLIGKVNDYGNTPSTIGDNIPYFNPGLLLSITKVTCSYSGVCMLLNTGYIKCTGGNSNGLAGIGVVTDPIGENSGHVGNSLPFVNLGTGVTVTNIVGGKDYNCALLPTGLVKCFGRNTYGQLGQGDIIERGSSLTHMGNELPAINFGTDVKVASIHSSSIANHNCVVLSAPAASAQRFKCWGHNVYYQLGYGDINNRGGRITDMGDNLPVVDLGTESRVKYIAVGADYTCALLLNEALKCFGYGYYGQIGSGSNAIISSTGNSMPIVTIDSGRTIKLLSASCMHTCIVYNDLTTMKCFGINDMGQLGQGDKIQRGDTPTTLIPLIPAIDLGTGSLKIQSIHASLQFSCVIFIDGSVKCFGNNSLGEFAIGLVGIFGDIQTEMGDGLQFSELFSPTMAPTITPTKKPTKSPTEICSYNRSASCKRDSNCMWVKGDGVNRCEKFNCVALTKSKCRSESSRCAWNRTTRKCDPIT